MEQSFASTSKRVNIVNLKGQTLTTVAEAIRTHDVLIITAGAGLSVESGIPDFVDVDQAFPAIAHLALNVYEISNGDTFLKNPQFAWGVYGKRMNDYRRAIPHAGYAILLKWCMSKSQWWVYTSNIDRHFVRAGFPEEKVVECHRSLYEFQCSLPCCNEVWDGGNVEIKYDETDSPIVAEGDVPKCRRCGEAARPCTVLASDTRWLGDYTRRLEQDMDRQLESLPLSKSIAVLEIGCGIQMPKVRNKSEELVFRFRDAGHKTTFVRINPTIEHIQMPVPSHPDNIYLCDTALESLQKLDKIIFNDSIIR